MPRKVPEINGGSLADIAFMLLIFFLVATTMNVDSGLLRRLPPMPEEDQPKDAVKVKERNILKININKYDRFQVDGRPGDVNSLTEIVKEFILNPTNSKKLPERHAAKSIPYYGNFAVSKGVVSIKNDRGTTYSVYLQIQNEVIRAFNEIRETEAKRLFRKSFADIPKEKQDAIKKAFPLSLSEAEPVNIGDK